MEELEELDLRLIESDDPERRAIDFAVADDVDNVAWVWGDRNIEWECTHPTIEYGDDDEQGECPLCGATCDWHWEDDGEGYKERVPHRWYNDRLGGVLRKVIKEMLETRDNGR